MNRKNRDSDYLRTLAERVRQYRIQVSEAEKQSMTAYSALEDARQELAAAELFYEMELQRLGREEEQVRLSLEGETRFMGMSAKEACVQLLRQHGEMTLDQLVTGLEAGGFVFRGSPKRVVNMALLGRDDVERVPGGIFRYREKGS